MAQAILNYSRALTDRLLWPLQPVKPVLQLIKVWYLLAILLLLELIAAFWPLSKAVTIKNNLAAWPWSVSIRRETEILANQPGDLQKEIEAWEAVMAEKAETRDGLLRLSVLSYRLYDDDGSRAYWERAFYLDPGWVASLPFRPPEPE